MRFFPFQKGLVLGLALLLGGAVQAATCTVTTPNDTNGTCSVSSCSLREAIKAADASPEADIITFNLPGTGPQVVNITQNDPNSSFDNSFALRLQNNITIQGPGADQLTIRWTGAPTQTLTVFTIPQDATIGISGITIADTTDSVSAG